MQIDSGLTVEEALQSRAVEAGGTQRQYSPVRVNLTQASDVRPQSTHRSIQGFQAVQSGRRQALAFKPASRSQYLCCPVATVIAQRGLNGLVQTFTTRSRRYPRSRERTGLLVPWVLRHFWEPIGWALRWFRGYATFEPWGSRVPSDPRIERPFRTHVTIWSPRIVGTPIRPRSI